MDIEGCLFSFALKVVAVLGGEDWPGLIVSIPIAKSVLKLRDTSSSSSSSMLGKRIVFTFAVLLASLKAAVVPGGAEPARIGKLKALLEACGVGNPYIAPSSSSVSNSLRRDLGALIVDGLDELIVLGPSDRAVIA
jgi:hypothetical protein